MRKPNVASTTTVDMAKLKQEINQKLLEIVKHDKKCKMHSDKAFEATIRAGELLNRCKRELGYGAFGDWQKKNIKVSPKTSACYMALAERWEDADKMHQKWPFLTTTMLYELLTGAAKKAEEILVVGDEKFVITREVIQKAKKRFNEECTVAKAACKPEPKTMVIDAKALEPATPSVAPQAGAKKQKPSSMATAAEHPATGNSEPKTSVIAERADEPVTPTAAPQAPAKTQLSSPLPTVPERPANGFTPVWVSKEDYATLISLRQHPEELIPSVLSRVIHFYKTHTPTSVEISTGTLVAKENGSGKAPSPTSTTSPAPVLHPWTSNKPRNVNSPRRVPLPCPPAGKNLSSVALRSVVTELRKKKIPCSLPRYVTRKPLPASTPQLPISTAPSVPLHGNVSPNVKKTSKGEKAKVKKLVKISREAGSPCEITMSTGEKVICNGGVTPQTYEQLDMFDEGDGISPVRPKPRKRTAGNK